MISDAVQIALISMVGGMGTAYIVNVLAKRVQSNKVAKQPKDRMEQMFDGYERLIKQKDESIDRLEKDLEAMRREITATREENARLLNELDEMRRQYRVAKKEN